MNNCDIFQKKTEIVTETFSGSRQQCPGPFVLISTTKYLHQRKRRKGKIIVIIFKVSTSIENQFSKWDSF